MSSTVVEPDMVTSSQLAAVSIDSGAALALCGMLLEVLSQMPAAQPLIRAALERDPTIDLNANPAALAAELMAISRLREACDDTPLKAA